MGDLLNAIISGAKAFGKAVGDAAGSIGQAVVGAVVSGVQSVAAILVSGVRAIVGAFVAGVVSLVSIATGIAGAAIGFVSKLIGEIVQVGGNLLQGFINTISPPIIDSAVIEVTLHGSHPLHCRRSAPKARPRTDARCGNWNDRAIWTCQDSH